MNNNQYEDNQIIDNANAFSVRANFQSLDNLEHQDLEEILERLYEQKEQLVMLPNHENLIKSIDRDIARLRELLPEAKVASAEEPRPNQNNLPPNPPPRPEPPRPIPPNPPRPEPPRPNPPIPPRPEPPRPTPPPPPRPPRPNFSFLERTLLWRLLYGNRRRNRNNLRSVDSERVSGSTNTQSHLQYEPWEHSHHHGCEPFPPYPPKHDFDRCHPIDKCITGEMDILRLLLLYMSLRPRCRYMRVLSDISVNHLSILGELLDTK